LAKGSSITFILIAKKGCYARFYNAKFLIRGVSRSERRKVNGVFLKPTLLRLTTCELIQKTPQMNVHLTAMEN
ncbi:MAG: hypothetical protein QXM10_08565, partial [Metallosphaera sp.]